jgi:hypothetical protein
VFLKASFDIKAEYDLSVCIKYELFCLTKLPLCFTNLCFVVCHDLNLVAKLLLIVGSTFLVLKSFTSLNFEFIHDPGVLASLKLASLLNSTLSGIFKSLQFFLFPLFTTAVPDLLEFETMT